VRTTHGGPAPAETARAIKASRELLATDERWLSQTKEKLCEADVRLKEAARGI
jgi:hypothetical protein